MKFLDLILPRWSELTSRFYTQLTLGFMPAAIGFSSASCLVASYSVLWCDRCKFRTELGPAVCVLYSLVGNLCNVAGAFLSNQFLLLRLMASLMILLDVVHLIFVTFPVCWQRYSKTGKRVRMISKRRRQNLLAVFLLLCIGGSVYLDNHIHHMQPITSSSPTNRKLQNVNGQDHTEWLGYMLGLLFFTISWTSRFPFILKAIVIVSCYGFCHKNGSIKQLGSDTESLLGGWNRSSTNRCHGAKEKRQKKQLPSRKSGSPKMTKLGRYMDVSAQPARKVCLKEVTITREGSAESQPLKRCVRVIRVDECYSSGSTTDSSCLSSELEWDFEEATSQWSLQSSEQQCPEAVALQDRLVEQRSKSDTRPSARACFCAGAVLEEKMAPVPPDGSLIQSGSVK